MKSRVIVLSLCIVLSFAAVSFAATYYVATNGNDKNDGSAGSPWATLQKAADTVAAGDTVIVKNGSYAGWHVYGKGGNADALITFKAETAGGATLNAASPKAQEKSIIDMRGQGGSTNDYWVIDGFVVDGGNKKLMTVDCRWVNNCVFENLTVYGSNSRGLYISHGNSNLTVNCVSHDNGEHGSYCANAGIGNTFRKNTCYDNKSEGMQTNGDLSMGGNGLGLRYLYEKNVIYDNPDKGFNMDGCCESLYRNNLLYGNRGGGIALFQIDAAKGASDDKIYNNTVVQPSGRTWCVVMPSSAYNSAKGPNAAANKFANNILSGLGAGSIATWSATETGIESDYNIVMNAFSFDNGDTTVDLAAWREHGYDKHSVVADPPALFVNQAGNDYHLKAGSPAAGAGKVVADVTDDMDGNARPKEGACDIGCYQTKAAAAQTK